MHLKHQKEENIVSKYKKDYEGKLIAIKSKTIFYSIDLYENFATKRHQKAKRSMRAKRKIAEC